MIISVPFTLLSLSISVVWNPWEEKAKQMSDFGDDEYTKMVCVEAGYVSKPMVLQPEQTFFGSQTIAVKG